MFSTFVSLIGLVPGWAFSKYPAERKALTLPAITITNLGIIMNSAKRIASSILLITIVFVSKAQNRDSSLSNLEKTIDSLILARMNSEHIPGVAFIIIKDGKVLLKKGYGYARLGSDMQKVDPDSTIFRIGSISKTFTATALLHLADSKKIELNKDVNKYLKTIKVSNTFENPVTSAHLLSHSAGFDEIGKGRVVYTKDEQMPLANFLKDRLIRIRPSGVIPAYSTYGIALAGLIIEDVSNLSLESYFKKNIWQPLDMNRTCIEVPANLRSYAALGYEYEEGINKPQPWEWYHTFPASSINSTVVDMGKYMQMHLNLGKFNNKAIVSKKLASEMQKRQISVHPKVGGFGYGFYENEWNGINTFDHGGDMAGFSSYMVLAQEENMGIFIVNHHENNNLRRDVVSTIMKHYHPFSNNSIPNKNLDIKQDAILFAGEYRWLSNCITCPDSNKQQTSKLKTNEDGTLSGFGRTFFQIEPSLFKSTDGQRTIGFRKNKEGKIQYMSLGNINVFEKLEIIIQNKTVPSEKIE
jgi:CubicO group peptidase (beta-lactamase class C family)